MEEEKKEFLTEWNFVSENKNTEKRKNLEFLNKKKIRESDLESNEKIIKDKDKDNEIKEVKKEKVKNIEETPEITIDNALDLTEEQKISRKKIFIYK
jgi:hypothetical protein